MSERKCVLHSVCSHTRLGSGGECVFWLCVQACASTHTQRKVGFRNCFLAILHSYKACTLPLHWVFRSVSLLFCPGGRGKCILIFIVIMHRGLFLSSVTCFPTKCPTSPAVIPGCGLHIISSLPCSPSAHRVRMFWQLLWAMGALVWVSVACLAGNLHIEM